MKKTLVCLLLCLSLLMSGSNVFAAGTAEDPLISKSYIDGSFTPSLLSKAREDIKAAVAAHFASSGSGTLPGGMVSLDAAAGGRAQMGVGQSIIVLSGEARASISAGTMVNASLGAAAVSGRLNTGHRYIICEDSSVTVDFSKDSSVLISASAAYTAPSGPVQPPVTEGELPFTDVLVSEWWYNDIAAAYERGLVNGMTLTTFEPRSDLSLSQCIKLAACMHQLYHEGSVTLENSPTQPWYNSYVDYAVENGIIAADFEDYSQPVIRSLFVDIIYNALPEDTYFEINYIPDGSISDLHEVGDWNKVYTLYRAGILTGYPAGDGYNAHDFGPDSTITRAELATIMNRMFDIEARQLFSMD